MEDVPRIVTSRQSRMLRAIICGVGTDITAMEGWNLNRWDVLSCVYRGGSLRIGGRVLYKYEIWAGKDLLSVGEKERLVDSKRSCLRVSNHDSGHRNYNCAMHHRTSVEYQEHVDYEKDPPHYICISHGTKNRRLSTSNYHFDNFGYSWIALMLENDNPWVNGTTVGRYLTRH